MLLSGGESTGENSYCRRLLSDQLSVHAETIFQVFLPLVTAACLGSKTIKLLRKLTEQVDLNTHSVHVGSLSGATYLHSLSSPQISSYPSEAVERDHVIQLKGDGWNSRIQTTTAVSTEWGDTVEKGKVTKQLKLACWQAVLSSWTWKKKRNQ